LKHLGLKTGAQGGSVRSRDSTKNKKKKRREKKNKKHKKKTKKFATGSVGLLAMPKHEGTKRDV
jgi:hypothetical protein